MKKVNWGILSTAQIGIQKVIPGMQKAENVHVSAIASRNLERAVKTAKALAIPKAFGSYEALLNDPDIQAVYIPLPNHLHVEWSIKSLKAGKHVLCEKPIGLDAQETQKLIEVSRQFPHLKIMEAFMYRFHPQWDLVLKLIRERYIGDLVSIDSTFSYYNDDVENVRNMKDIGGGGLMDIGCYNISISRYITGIEPDEVLGVMEFDPVFGTDRLTSGILKFGHITSTFSCATQMYPYQRVHIFGRKGRIEIEIPFNAPIDDPCKVWLYTEGRQEAYKTKAVDQYTAQGTAMSDAILNDMAVPTPLVDALANMQVIDRLRVASTPINQS